MAKNILNEATVPTMNIAYGATQQNGLRIKEGSKGETKEKEIRMKEQP